MTHSRPAANRIHAVPDVVAQPARGSPDDAPLLPPAADVVCRRASARMLTAMRREPARRRMLTVAGVSGSGKTTLLAAIARELRSSGVITHRDIGSASAEGAEREVVLVDDAELLEDDALDRLLALACRDEGPSFVVAFRTAAGRPALRAITERLDAADDALRLEALDEEDVAAWSSHALGRHVAADELARVRWLTGGLPWLVDVTLDAMRDAAGAPLLGDMPGVMPGELPGGLVERVARVLGRLAPELASFALALSIGFDAASFPAASFDARGRAAAPRDARRFEAWVEEAREAGLVGDDDRPVPLVGAALLRTTPARRVLALQRSLLDAYAATGRPVDALAKRGDAWHELKDARMVDALVRLGDGTLERAPATAMSHYAAALTASTDSAELAEATRMRRAQASLAAGDLQAAGLLIERHFSAADPVDVARGVDVAASYWAERCMPPRSADVYRWLGEARIGHAAANAAIAFIGEGRLDGAERMRRLTESRFPTAATASARMAAEGLFDSLALDAAPALPQLVRAFVTLNASGRTTPQPELPAALAALVALHQGDHATVASVLDAALAAGQGGPSAQRRLLTLRAWSLMLSGHGGRAAELADSARNRSGQLAQRDELLLLSLDVALARRSADVAALARAWAAARECLMRVSMGLFTLLPLGELIVAAARMRDSSRVAQALADAWRVLEGVGSPPLWATPLHWACVQAGIVANRPGELSPHAEALVRAAAHHPLAAKLAGAGRCWVHVLGGRVDADAVEAAARRLADAGMPWDGAHLAGHAAARAAERKDMLHLLQTARELNTGSGADGAAVPATPTGRATADGGGSDRAAAFSSDGPGASATTPSAFVPEDRAGTNGSSRGGEVPNGGSPPSRIDSHEALELSAREWQVATLVLEGKTYVEVGRELFMSPRTVEHHMARIRRRLGASSRSELLDRLRAAQGRRA